MSTICGVRMRITRRKPSSKRSRGRCAWRWRSIHAPDPRCPQRRERCRAPTESLAGGECKRISASSWHLGDLCGPQLSSMTYVAVVDYGMGNLRSVSKALEHVAPQRNVVVTSDPAAIAAAERVVFPGQGAMPDCMRELGRFNLRDAVVRAAPEKPLLGICIGAQMLFEWSAEGATPGLGIFRGKVQRFPADRLHDAPGGPLKVPHMGWNSVRQTASHPLWHGIPDRERFYFCHSYFFRS